MKIHKGDTVQIMVGKDKGKQGKVLTVNSKEGLILVEGINLVKKHQRPKRQGEKGETISMPKFLNVSKAKLICQFCNKPVRVGFRKEGEKKTRYCKKCQATI
jgi:large subunit ribosomal protein L24